MTSKEAIAKLNVLSSYDTTKEKRDEYKECIYAIQKDLETLEIIKNNFKAYKDLYHDGKWQLTLKQKNVFVEGSKEYELLKEWL